MDDFLIKLAEILEEDSVNREDELANFPTWDSLGVLSVIAMIDETYGVTITADDISKISTIGELQDLVQERLKK